MVLSEKAEDDILKLKGKIHNLLFKDHPSTFNETLQASRPAAVDEKTDMVNFIWYITKGYEDAYYITLPTVESNDPIVTAIIPFTTSCNSSGIISGSRPATHDKACEIMDRISVMEILLGRLQITLKQIGLIRLLGHDHLFPDIVTFTSDQLITLLDVEQGLSK